MLLRVHSYFTSLKASLAREEGATMVEYGLMVALIAIVAMIAAEVLGEGVFNIFGDAAEELGETAPPLPGG